MKWKEAKNLVRSEVIIAAAQKLKLFKRSWKNTFRVMRKMPFYLMDENKNGCVAFLDILGYQSFLEENPGEEAAQNVLRFINSLNELKLSSHVTSIEEKLSIPQDTFNTLVFSDTILLTAQVTDDTPLGGADVITLFLYRVAHLSRLMFQFGLPLRGAVTFGDYRIASASFTGKAIVDAYKIAGTLDLACTVVSNDFIKAMDERNERAQVGRAAVIRAGLFFVDYNVPTKLGRQRYLCINFAKKVEQDSYNQDLSKEDLTKWVLESFWKHGKHMDDRAELKAKNTELFLRYCRFVHPDDFQ